MLEEEELHSSTTLTNKQTVKTFRVHIFNVDDRCGKNSHGKILIPEYTVDSMGYSSEKSGKEAKVTR